MVGRRLSYTGPRQYQVQATFREITDGLLGDHLNRSAVAGVVRVQSRDEADLLPPARVPGVDGPLDWYGILQHLRADYVTPDPPALSREERDVATNQLYGEFVAGDVSELVQDLTARGWSPVDAEEASELLVDCLSARLLIGGASPFWERVAACLEAGLLPIAWTGHWPAGELVALDPAREQ
jgi:hypothetical protein